MLKKILGSRTRISVLKLFVFNPKKEFYIREIERLTKEPFDPVRLELARLESIGLLKGRISGKQKYYSVNTNHTLFPEFKSIILKTIGLGDVLKDYIERMDKITVCFIYGSYAKNTEDMESDIDIFAAGDISSKEFLEVTSKIENQIKREINPTIYSIRELKERYKTKNNFIISLLKEPKIFLKGDENALRKLVSGK